MANIDWHCSPFTGGIPHILSKLYSSHLSSGQGHSDLASTIMISILNYPMYPYETDKFHTVFHLKEAEEHFNWIPDPEIHAVELSQFMVKWKKYRL